MTGKKILHYRIIEEIGRGGMGVVYKAEDTKLERIVALKFLPTNTITGAEEKKRFKREAKAAAALNHPNICHIYAIDEADEQLFIAMEFIEGQSLAEMIGAKSGSPLAIPDAINYATQIAAGLQAAHEKGIVHRDIKSANIMVTDKGVVKIMDFGLAKLGNRTMMTKEGTTLGTAAYMSPEQARGEIVDQRSDIWSLGVVLYEMLSGRVPFKGDFEQAVVYSILNEEPEPLTALRSALPIALDGIIAEALAKDPAVRYQHVDELPADLKALDTVSLSRSRISTASRPVIGKKKLQTWVPWAIAAAVFFVAFLAMVVIHFREIPEEKEAVRFTIPMPVGLTDMQQPNVSPDGRVLAFLGTDSSNVTSIWLRPLQSLESRPVQGTENVAEFICWSPDSRFILYRTADAKLKKINTTGGAATTIMETRKFMYFSSGSWSKGSTILYSFFPRADGIYQVPSTGGSPMLVTTVDTTTGERAHLSPVFLPDDEHFLYNVNYTQGKDDIYVGSLDSKERKLLVRKALLLSYVSPGYLWYVSDGTLMAQPFDAKRLRLSGEPVAIVSEFGRSGRFRVTVSETGVMVFQDLRSNPQLTWFDREGKRLGKIGEGQRFSQITLSPDEKRLAAQIGALSGPQEIWIGDIDRALFSRFATGMDPIWSPDGSRLLFISDSKIREKNLDGGAEKLFLETTQTVYPEHWTQDGRYALGTSLTSDSGAIWVIPTSGTKEPIPAVEASFQFDEPQVSPDGRLLAYIANETGRNEVYVQPFLKRGQRIRISGRGGGQPKWRKDGKELFFLALDGTLMAVDIREAGTITAGVPKPLFRAPVNVRPNLDQFAVTGDGQRFLVITEGDRTSRLFEVVLNWPEVFFRK